MPEDILQDKTALFRQEHFCDGIPDDPLHAVVTDAPPPLSADAEVTAAFERDGRILQRVRGAPIDGHPRTAPRRSTR
jgi:hypothetical protein